jgi:hypothetical protein
MAGTSYSLAVRNSQLLAVAVAAAEAEAATDDAANRRCRFAGEWDGGM